MAKKAIGSFNFGANVAKAVKAKKSGGGGKKAANLRGASFSPIPGGREWYGSQKKITLYFGGS